MNDERPLRSGMVNRIDSRGVTQSVSTLENSHDEEKIKFPKIDWIAYTLLVIVIFITWYSYPSQEYGDDGNMSLQFVWYCSWLTAVATGLGIIPFIFLKEPENYYLGISNG